MNDIFLGIIGHLLYQNIHNWPGWWHSDQKPTPHCTARVILTVKKLRILNWAPYCTARWIFTENESFCILTETCSARRSLINFEPQSTEWLKRHQCNDFVIALLHRRPMILHIRCSLPSPAYSFGMLVKSLDDPGSFTAGVYTFIISLLNIYLDCFIFIFCRLIVKIYSVWS